MRLYLDNSVYNRPFDDQSQPRIWLETLALAVILQLVETGQAELISSTVVDYENSHSPSVDRRRWVRRCTRLSTHRQRADAAVGQRAVQLVGKGFKKLDALHLACAEAARVDYFVTCDDRLVRRARRLGLKVVNPLEFVQQTAEEI